MHKKYNLLGFLKKFYLNFLEMILTESSCNFCFLIANPPHLFRKVLGFDILPKNILIQLKSIGSGQACPTLS